MVSTPAGVSDEGEPVSPRPTLTESAPTTPHSAATRLQAALPLAAAASLLMGPSDASAQSLRGSGRSLDLQNRVAAGHDFTYVETGERIRYFATQGWLVEVRPTSDFELHRVSFPYARPEVDLFLRRLSAQYRAACGERLVVTSLARPIARQPRNASDRSVHPTGMAVDLRYNWRRACRTWLERVLLDLERAGVLEATLERHPAHYHVAIFPRDYAAYVERLEARQATRVASTRSYTVRRGDSLWTIAQRLGTTVDGIRRANALDGSRIYAGQILEVPASSH